MIRRLAHSRLTCQFVQVNDHLIAIDWFHVMNRHVVVRLLSIFQGIPAFWFEYLFRNAGVVEVRIGFPVVLARFLLERVTDIMSDVPEELSRQEDNPPEN